MGALGFCADSSPHRDPVKQHSLRMAALQSRQGADAPLHAHAGLQAAHCWAAAEILGIGRGSSS